MIAHSPFSHTPVILQPLIIPIIIEVLNIECDFGAVYGLEVWHTSSAERLHFIGLRVKFEVLLIKMGVFEVELFKISKV
jgi:hypothetical protein